MRDNAHKLEDRPSKRAWERLENRLDEHKSKRRFSFRSTLSIAASVVALVGLVSIISFMFQNQESAKYATESVTSPEFEVVKLETPVEEEQGFYKIVEFQKTYENRLSNPIIEGSGKKLSVAKSHRKFSNPAEKDKKSDIRN